MSWQWVYPDLTPEEREGKAISLRRAIELVKAELNGLLREVFKIEELEKDVSGTLQSVLDTKVALRISPWRWSQIVSFPL